MDALFDYSRGYCYAGNLTLQTKQNDAQEYCENLGGRLAIFPDEADWKFLIDSGL